MRTVLAITLVALLLVNPSSSLDNGLSLTPALGYNTW